METMRVKAELTYRDGKKEKIAIQLNNNENNLTSIIGGIHKLSEKVSNLLSELVEQEKSNGASTQGVKEDSSDEDDEEEEEKPPKCDPQPPAKRSKT